MYAASHWNLPENAAESAEERMDAVSLVYDTCLLWLALADFACIETMLHTCKYFSSRRHIIVNTAISKSH